MDEKLPHFLNKALDLAAAGSFLTKTFTIYVLIVHTPKKMRHLSNLILVGILWNFMGNSLFTFAHLIPMLPAQCFCLDGMLSDYLESEFAGHFVTKLIVVTVLNTSLAVALSFQFRYMEVVHSKRFASFHPVWGYIYCLLVYMASSSIIIVLYDNWSIPVVDYPLANQLPRGERLFCMQPHGLDKNLVIGYFVGAMCVGLLAVAFFSERSFRHLNQKHPGMHEKTILLQKRILRNLLSLMLIPIFSGGIPILVFTACLYFNEMQEARLIFSISIVIVLNYGTIYCITTLVVFKDYRKATKTILMNVARRFLWFKRRIGKKSDAWAQNVV